jgi:PadR family transcriptional regulator PadR
MTVATQRILRELLDTPGELYGREICRAAGFAGGTVHPILAKFEALGWLESRMEDLDPAVAGRPRRRYYRLTTEGKRFVWDALTRARKPI